MRGGRYQIEFLEAAEVDLRTTSDWLVDHKPELARHWEADVRNGIRSLAQFPARCPRAVPGDVAFAGVHKLVLDDDVVLFRIVAQRVTILRVFHEGRDPTLH